jgi:eukaryotic-like serine/threonine-protein kinase
MTRTAPDSHAGGPGSGTDPEMPFEDPDARVDGCRIGPWLLLDRVDAGSYGIVYRARLADREDSPPVAVKVARQPGDCRFEREVEALRRVQHPNLPKLEGHGEWTDPEGRRRPYVAMELVPGLLLYAWAQARRPTSRQYLRVLAQVARALAALHAADVMHREVKGDNIVVTPEGRAVLLDLGCCWHPGARPVTDTAMPPGTTPYRPPAMLRFAWRFRRDMDARYECNPADDLYSLGVAAYKALTGTYPPPPTESEEARSRIVPPSRWCTCAPELEALVMRMLADSNAERGTAAALAEALESAAQGGAHLDRRVELGAAALPTEEGAPPQSGSGSNSRRQSSDASRTRREALPMWLSWAGAGMLGGLVVVGGAGLWRVQGLGPMSVAEERHVPRMDAPDAGVASEALASSEDFPRVGVPVNVMGRSMPKQPFPGQRKPPCEERVEKAINGACWVGVADEKPPCGPKMFDHEDRCYLPSYDAPRQPASEKQ